MKTIIIKNEIHGNGVFGREKGKSIREKFLKDYKEGYKINLDFMGIETVTHSFTDELIGIFLYFDGKDSLNKLQFSNCNNDVKNMLKFVINDRITEFNHNKKELVISK